MSGSRSGRTPADGKRVGPAGGAEPRVDGTRTDGTRVDMDAPEAARATAEAMAGRTDLLGEDHGGRALLCSDEFFAAASNLVRPGPAHWDAERYTDRGKWMDGWESRRRRGPPGHDWCLLELGLPGLVERIVVDTSHFRGNQPAACALEVCDGGHLPEDLLAAGAVGADGEPAIDGLWTELLPRTRLDPHTLHVFDVDPDLAARAAGTGRVTHARLRIFPDGGVARLRLLGRVAPEPGLAVGAGADLDLARIDHGARVLGCSDAFFSAPGNLLRPALSRGMHDGWETRRRRGPGHDWVVIELAAAGRIDRVEVDTSHFKGNAPGSCALWISDEPVPPERHGDEPGPSSSWRPLLPNAPLGPDALHVFTAGAGGGLTDQRRGRFVRFDIHPDGGVARLRLIGETDECVRLRQGLARLDDAPEDEARAMLTACCGSAAWVDAMLAARPFGDPGALGRAADECWRALDDAGRLEAFAAHPEIGAVPRAEAGDRHASWSAGEQASTAEADADVLARLADGNRRYRERFGHVFLVCATGRRPEEMLALLERRLQLDPETERAVAAEHQRRITALRLIKLLGEP